MVEQIFLSPQMKRSVIISNKLIERLHIYDLYDLMKLENIRKNLLSSA